MIIAPTASAPDGKLGMNAGQVTRPGTPNTHEPATFRGTINIAAEPCGRPPALHSNETPAHALSKHGEYQQGREEIHRDKSHLLAKGHSLCRGVKCFSSARSARRDDLDVRVSRTNAPRGLEKTITKRSFTSPVPSAIPQVNAKRLSTIDLDGVRIFIS